jgi:cytochrome c
MPKIPIGHSVRIASMSLLLVISVVLLSACTNPLARTAAPVANGDPRNGPHLLRQYGCAGCHAIPGVKHADGWVGPPLENWSGRGYIAGRIPNTPENLITWIQNPQAIDPENVMPNMGVVEQDARDMAAYLFTLGGRTRYDGVMER